MFRRRIYGGMPIAPSESVGNSIIYVQAPWHKDLSPYNRSIYRETQFLDAKVQGLWAFHSSYAYGGLVFNDGNEMKPERQNDFAMELKFLLTTKDLILTRLISYYQGIMGIIYADLDLEYV